MVWKPKIAYTEMIAPFELNLKNNTARLTLCADHDSNVLIIDGTCTNKPMFCVRDWVVPQVDTININVIEKNKFEHKRLDIVSREGVKVNIKSFQLKKLSIKNENINEHTTCVSGLYNYINLIGVNLFVESIIDK